MTNDDSVIQTQEEVDKLNNQNDPLTPEDQDDNFTEGGDVATNPDEMHKRAFGDTTDGETITEEINKDEVAIAKDLDEDQQ